MRQTVLNASKKKLKKMKVFLKKVWRYENELYLCVALRNKAANESSSFLKIQENKKYFNKSLEM